MIDWLFDIWYEFKRKRIIRRKIKEAKKRDPFIY
jgi:hypothetical protein